MRRKQNARSDAATSKRARQEALGRALPESDFTATLSDGQGGVSRFLLHGEKNAVPAADLAKFAGCADTRELRKRIQKEREHGAIILIGDGGYFLPSFDDRAQLRRELEAFERTFDARCRSNRASVRPVKRVLKQLRRCELDGQQQMKEV